MDSHKLYQKRSMKLSILYTVVFLMGSVAIFAVKLLLNEIIPDEFWIIFGLILIPLSIYALYDTHKEHKNLLSVAWNIILLVIPYLDIITY